MRAVLQRVRHASVTVEGEIVGQIEEGFLVLLGVGQGDTAADVDYIVDRVSKLRAFADQAGKMNLSIDQIGGSVLLVSQFTLLADLSGRRPGFTAAAPPAVARELYEYACERFRAAGVPLQTGIFAADMQVELLNDGPVTFIIESPKKS